MEKNQLFISEISSLGSLAHDRDIEQDSLSLSSRKIYIYENKILIRCFDVISDPTQLMLVVTVALLRRIYACMLCLIHVHISPERERREETGGKKFVETIRHRGEERNE
jgi:hypothetical protein